MDLVENDQATFVLGEKTPPIGEFRPIDTRFKI